MKARGYDKRDCPTLRKGARGQAVVRAQKRLVEHLHDLDEASFVDGDFGPSTERELRRFQKRERLMTDGIVGRDTWCALLRKPGERVASPVGRTARTEDRRIAADEAGSTSAPSSLAARVKRALRTKGYAYLDDGKGYHLNIVGVRSASTRVNSFDDRVVLLYRDERGQTQSLEYAITTDPGEYFTRQKLLNKAGAAILVPGQYRDTYKIAKHRRKYEALCQRGGPVKIWRDANKDETLDRTGKVHEGWYGINIHRAGQSGTTTEVGRYSAGCQVFANAGEFVVLMGLAKRSRDLRGNTFTYTLLDDADIK